uniref:Uncharacterized protein n=1 Tax=Magallana gigas TaxID=29159 RepID=A0A8W8J0I2_MAGGI
MCICVTLTVAFVALLIYLALKLQYHGFKVTGGKTIIVTGAEQGRGFQITLELVKKKARVIMACADDNNGRKARQNTVQRTGNTDVVVQHLHVTMISSATEGALSVLLCALDDSVQTGGYYIDGQLMDHTPSVPVSVYDERLTKKLWEVSERLMGTFEERKITSGTKISNGRVIDRLNCKTGIMSELELAKRRRDEEHL